MKKISTHAVKTTITQNGLQVQAWIKVCPCCHKEYTTTSRGQKYCSSVCLKTATTKKRKQKQEYDKNKSIHRLAARSHAIAVEVLRNLVELGVVEYKCECGCTENLQVHHRNGKWLDNSPANLVYLCPKCHAEAHALLTERNSKGSSWGYDELETNIYEVLLK